MSNVCLCVAHSTTRNRSKIGIHYGEHMAWAERIPFLLIMRACWPRGVQINNHLSGGRCGGQCKMERTKQCKWISQLSVSAQYWYYHMSNIIHQSIVAVSVLLELYLLGCSRLLVARAGALETVAWRHMIRWISGGDMKYINNESDVVLTWPRNWLERNMYYELHLKCISVRIDSSLSH